VEVKRNGGQESALRKNRRGTGMPDGDDDGEGVLLTTTYNSLHINKQINWKKGFTLISS
jgi:hypothetical protein